MRFLWRPNSKTNSHEGDKNEISHLREIQLTRSKITRDAKLTRCGACKSLERRDDNEKIG